MRKDEVERLLKEAARKYSENKKVAKRPETQFMAGAWWLWDLLMSAKDITYYEEVLRRELTDRIGDVEPWKESLIFDTAKMMADRDGMEEDIRIYGRLVTKTDKNLHQYVESNPLYVHLKELQRSIGLQREHLGLSNKVNPERIKADAKKGASEDDTLNQALAATRAEMNDPDAFIMPG